MSESESSKSDDKDKVCEICGATENLLTVTQVFGKQQQSVTMCRNCASVLGIEQSESPFAPQVGDLMAAVFDPSGVGPKDNLYCEHCGTSFFEVRRQGLCGCAECYDVFSTEISTMLRRISGRRRYRGKLPRRLARVKSLLQEKPELERELVEALQKEDYELAADIRDRIRRIDAGDPESAAPGMRHGGDGRQDSLADDSMESEEGEL